MEKDPHRYDDMINMPHHKSNKRPPMSMENRAAQFSPFQALTGYQDAVKETARLTQEKIQLDEGLWEELDLKIKQILAYPDSFPSICVTWFMPDQVKNGGDYITCTGAIKKIDSTERKIILSPQKNQPCQNEIVINIDDIIAIE